jgi:ABC-type phosphate transport system permease subunit
MSAQTPPRRPPQRATLQPRFTLTLFYFFVFFLLYSLLLASLDLMEVWRTLPPEPAQQEAAKEAAKEAVQGRLWMPLLAAMVTTGIGLYAGLLPGARFKD